MQQPEQPWRFAERIGHIPKSFLREILKITAQSDVISFAGGLPNPSSFPIEAIKQAALKVLQNDGQNVLQYAPSEGYLPLRKYLADRYARKGIAVTADEILITNGSQQGLDLIAKIFIDKGDTVLLERPSYLGAIQAFSISQPNFLAVPLQEDGIDIQELEKALAFNPTLFYAIPNFQNPTGQSYSHAKRKKVAELMNASNTLLVEDDPYGDIKFTDHDYFPIKKDIHQKGILLGSFSKIISPGMRMGWIVAAPGIIEKLLIAKQASDLHSNFLSQRIIYQYLIDNDLDAHIQSIIQLYRSQKDFMVAMMKEKFPDTVQFTDPEGGMFIWITLPQGLSAQKLLELAMQQNVVFVPGEVFYVDGKTNNTLRINYSNSNMNDIERGISILGRCIHTLLDSNVNHQQTMCSV